MSYSSRSSVITPSAIELERIAQDELKRLFTYLFHDGLKVSVIWNHPPDKDHVQFTLELYAPWLVAGGYNSATNSMSVGIRHESLSSTVPVMVEIRGDGPGLYQDVIGATLVAVKAFHDQYFARPTVKG